MQGDELPKHSPVVNTQVFGGPASSIQFLENAIVLSSREGLIKKWIRPSSDRYSEDILALNVPTYSM